jgi:hypothetical protein
VGLSVVLMDLYPNPHLLLVLGFGIGVDGTSCKNNALALVAYPRVDPTIDIIFSLSNSLTLSILSFSDTCANNNNPSGISLT